MNTKEDQALSLGILRLQRLKEADSAYGAGELDYCHNNIEAFLQTIPDESKSAALISEGFDKIVVLREKNKKRLYDDIQELGIMEAIDIKNKGEVQIFAEELSAKRAVCWQIAFKTGLFDE